MTTTTTTPPSDVTADEFAERLFGAALGTMEILSVHLGDRLGWYRALAEGGPASPEELVARAGGNLRYAREWLEQQAVYGILEAADSGEGGADERRFTLPPGAREVLTDTSSLGYLGPLARMLVGSAVQMPALLAAYRHGGGVSWAQLGEDARESQADMNRPWFERELARALQGVDTVDAVLRRPGARIADIGCGAGWSSIALSRAYPQASVDGHDVDAPSVSLANTNAAAAGVASRVTFSTGDGGELAAEASYDAAFFFECLHDMPQPVAVLAAARRAVKPDGLVIVMDEAVAERFAAPGDDLERLMYGFSLLVCLPDGMAHQPTAATGTVMRLDTLRDYARQAGFRDVSVLDIRDFGFWRFYRLHQ